MAQIIEMPRLSDTMTDGIVSKWYKQVGEKIKEGDIIADIETDKATQEFESEFAGTLLYIGAKEGESIAINELIAIIGDEKEDISGFIPNKTKKEKTETKQETQEIETVSTSSSTEIPAGIEIITMPRLSDTMTEGKVQKWYKNVGDILKEGDIITDIETDKAIQEFESEYNGVLLHIGAEEGESIEVDKTLAIIGPAGTDVSNILDNLKAGKTNSIQEKETITPVAQTVQEKKADADIKPNTGRIFISPLAKKMALEKNIDFANLIGSGDGGRIIAKDIEDFKANTVLIQVKSSEIINTSDTELPMGSIRKVAAKRLSESKFTAPHFYLSMELEMDQMMKLREEINKSIAPNKVSFNDLLIKFLAMAIKKHPAVNVTWAEDKIIQHNNIHIGVAVAIDEGLLVPVINYADQKSFTTISEEIKDKAKRARERKIKAEELSGSTFSISNLGSYGIESFTSIINQPNACILSVGAIIEKPVVKNHEIVIGNTMKITLACDHRTVDGATGSKFLQTFKQYVENPLLLFI